MGTPHRLRVTRLAFTGEKAGVFSDEINFEQHFTDGLWALASDKNERGKTSVLEIMMWALRGQRKNVQDDVRSWLRSITLEGTVDDEEFVVEFELAGGEPVGVLKFDGRESPFSSETAFTETMSTFMMERLGFDSFPQWTKSGGISTHGWPLYSTALYMPHGAQLAVIGDTIESGLAQRLIQIFVGIPWARTSIACQAALREANAEASAMRSVKQSIQEAAGQRLRQRQEELESAREEFSRIPGSAPSEQRIEDARAEWINLIGQHAEAKSNQRKADHDFENARSEVTRRKKQLMDLSEAAIAERLFHGLDPSNCPRCQTPIGAERKRTEVESHSCAICTRPLEVIDFSLSATKIADSEQDDVGSVEDLRNLVEQAEEAATNESARLAELSKQVDSLEQHLSEAKRSVDDHTKQLELVEARRVLANTIATLEAVIAEMESLAGEDGSESPDPNDDLNLRIEVLDSAAKEAKDRVRNASGEIVGEINQAVLGLAQRFGLENLQDVRLNLAAQLRLKKGGVASSFSKQTRGEKLRLRIAVIVGLLRVAHLNGTGCHPGFLLIDSIGAEETEPGDVAAFMRELSAVADEIGAQVIVASARPEILEHVPEGHQIVAKGDGFLW